MKVLIFDIWGDFAHFKKIYTTTSPLCFSIPPHPTVAGILGAIYGTERKNNSHVDVFNYSKCKVGIRLINPVKKFRMGVKYRDEQGNHTPIRIELLRNPHFRLYVYHNDENIFKQLEHNIRNHISYFTVSLGLSYMLADFKYIDTCEAEELLNQQASVLTATRIDNIIEKSLIVSSNKSLFKEKIPLAMSTDRVVSKYCDVVYELRGKSIEAKFKNIIKLSNGEIITFL